MLTRTPVEGYVGCCHAIAGADLTESTKALTLPTLAIAGSEDGASPPDLVQGTAGMIAGSRFTVIEGAGHLPCVEDPAAYAALLTDFLKEHAHV
jgi:3-oxoadipate enol-lactonase